MSAKLCNLHALRGVACLLVFLFHVTAMESKMGAFPGSPFLVPFRYVGHSGVELFFIISGFILTWAHFQDLGDRSALGRYAFKRFWRIYPPYWVCAVGTRPCSIGFTRGITRPPGSAGPSAGSCWCRR